MMFFSGDVYAYDAIVYAAEQYRGLATIKLERSDTGTVCVLDDCLYDEELTQHEFENYVIALLNEPSSWQPTKQDR